LQDAQRRVGLVHSDFPVLAQQVADLLAADGAFSSIETWDLNANEAVPTLQDLQQYDAILVWSNFQFPSPSALGDVLADYWDAGGAVVAVEFSFVDAQSYPAYHLSGRFGDYANRYVLLDNINLPCTCGADYQLGVVSEPLSPLMADVSSGAGAGNCQCQVKVINDGILVASWSGTGWPLAVRGTRSGRNIVDLNVYPAAWPDAALFRDALLYSMSTPCPAGSFCPDTTCPAVGPAAPQPCPAGGYCPPGSTAPTPCPAGSYCPSAGLSAPRRCPGGHYCPGGGAAPVACAAGAFCPAGASAPTPCPAGRHCQAGVTAPTRCRDCAAGHYRGRCGRSASAKHPDGPCWRCPPCGGGHRRSGCGGDSPGTCVRVDWGPA